MFGCSGERAAELEHSTVRDSAGIEIVESSAPVWDDASRWQLADQPSLEIGAGVGGDPALQFANITGVHRLASGSIAVLDAWAPGVVFFDSTGTLIGRVGREGTGPGEFPPRSVRNSFACAGDTVFVVVGPKVAAYAPPGVYVRTFATAQPARINACSNAAIIAETRYGSWRNAVGVFTDSILLVAFNDDGSPRAVIDSLPRQRSNWVSGPEGFGYSVAPFSPMLSVAARDSTIATGFGERFEIELRHPSGAVRRIVRVLGQERRVEQSDVDQFLAFVLNPWRGNEDERRRLEQRISSAEGQPVPAFGELRIDDDGNLWARAYDHLDAVAFYNYAMLMRGFERPNITTPRRWAVLRRDGRYLGTLEMPVNFTVYEIGSDYVLGVWRDELDIQYVRQYPLIKPESSTR